MNDIFINKRSLSKKVDYSSNTSYYVLSNLAGYRQDDNTTTAVSKWYNHSVDGFILMKNLYTCLTIILIVYDF